MHWHRGISLSIQFDVDGPSTIARILSRFGEAGVRMEGNAKSGGTLRVLTADLGAARDVMRELGVTSQESEVAVVDVGTVPGAIAQILQDAAAAGRPITFMYAATKNRIVISAPDLDGLLAALMPEG